MMSDPYNLRPAIKFIAPYGLSECRQRLQWNTRAEKAKGIYIYKLSVSSWNLPKSGNRAAFKITGMGGNNYKGYANFLKFNIELHGTLTRLSDSETLVEANFRVSDAVKQMVKALWFLPFLVLIGLIVAGYIQNLTTENFMIFVAVFIFANIGISLVLLLMYGFGTLNQRGILRTFLKQQLSDDTVQLRKPKDTA